MHADTLVQVFPPEGILGAYERKIIKVALSPGKSIPKVHKLVTFVQFSTVSRMSFKLYIFLRLSLIVKFTVKSGKYFRHSIG